MKPYKKYRSLFLVMSMLLFLTFLATVNGQTKGIPKQPDKKMAVNDFANFFSPSEQQQLERKLGAIFDSTHVAIVVVVVKSMNGYEAADMATKIGHEWRIGKKGESNGLVILVKPKSEDGPGKFFIAPGYGAEGFITDALCKRITENEAVPFLKQGQYFQALDNSINALYSAIKKEIKPTNPPPKKKNKRTSKFPWAAVIIIGVLLIAFFRKGNSGNNRHFSSGSDLPFWMLMGGMMSGGRSGGGGFGDFSSGGGDFGGFEGGDFGGGGAGGDW